MGNIKKHQIYWEILAINNDFLLPFLNFYFITFKAREMDCHFVNITEDNPLCIFFYFFLARALHVTEIITIAIVTALIIVAIIFAGATCIVHARRNKDELHQPLLTDQYQTYSDEYDSLPTPSQSMV